MLTPSADSRVRLVEITGSPLDVAAVLSAVTDRRAGGIDLFVGQVRDHDSGRQVTRLEYSAHPQAGAALEAVCAEIAAEFEPIAVAAAHRIGSLEIGDAAVIVAVACAHRGEAFEATRALIDRLKERVPIWKHQEYGDGSTSWVGTP